MKRKIIWILLILIALTVISAGVLYHFYEPDKPWLAFYIACCAGVLVVNLGAIIFLVNKNFKEKD